MNIRIVLACFLAFFLAHMAQANDAGNLADERNLMNTRLADVDEAGALLEEEWSLKKLKRAAKRLKEVDAKELEKELKKVDTEELEQEERKKLEAAAKRIQAKIRSRISKRGKKLAKKHLERAKEYASKKIEEERVKRAKKVAEKTIEKAKEHAIKIAAEAKAHLKEGGVARLRKPERNNEEAASLNKLEDDIFDEDDYDIEDVHEDVDYDVDDRLDEEDDEDDESLLQIQTQFFTKKIKAIKFLKNAFDKGFNPKTLPSKLRKYVFKHLTVSEVRTIWEKYQEKKEFQNEFRRF